MNADAPVVVGTVIGAFGLRGDVKVKVAAFSFSPGMRLTAMPSPPFAAGRQASASRELRVSSVLPGRGWVRVHFEGIDDATSAQVLRGARLSIPRAALPKLPADAFLESDLIGMEVVDARTGAIGSVAGIAHYPSCDMLIVGPRRVLVPMLKAYGMRVDPAARRITVSLPPGFDELL